MRLIPTGTRPGVLTLARSFPNAALPTLGVWTERLVEASTEIVKPVVIAPVPYIPPGTPGKSASRLREVPREEERGGIAVHHPRIPLLPRHLLHRYEARIWYPFLCRVTERIALEGSVSLIHAHFIYPEGVVAVRLGRRLGIPVITTEHAMWLPWLERHPQVKRQVLDALPGLSLVTVVSEALAETVRGIGGSRVPMDILPNMVDEIVFAPPSASSARDPDRVVFVGAVRHVKGLDVLIRALPRLIRRRPAAHLVVVGEPYYRQYRKDQEAVERLIGELGLRERVRFTGRASPTEVASHMSGGAVLAVPSRRESFGAVIVEALATGTPVVATRCGGPEGIVTEAVGRLVAVEDPEAFADALADVMENPVRFPAALLREYSVSRWGRVATTERIRAIYARILSRRPPS